MYVPKDTKLHMEIIKLHHDSLVAGHSSQWKTLELISHNYWWPRITQKVNNYVSSCDRCRRMKSFPEKPTGKLKPNESTIAPWRDITKVDNTRNQHPYVIRLLSLLSGKKSMFAKSKIFFLWVGFAMAIQRYLQGIVY